MSDRAKPSSSKGKRDSSPSEPEVKRKKKTIKTEATGSLRHQIAPLDSIMEEMEKEVQRKKELAAAAAAEQEAIAREADHRPEIARLTRDALENMPVDNTMVSSFVKRDCIMYQLLGHKMMDGRLQAYPNLGYIKSEFAVFPQYAYDRIGPQTPPHQDDQPSNPRRGPKTPPGSPGPRTPPCSPPAIENKPAIQANESRSGNPVNESRSGILANVAALTGSDVNQLEAFLGSELSEALGSMEKAAILEKIKDALLTSVRIKKEAKEEPQTPVQAEVPRRSRDNASVQMELVSDESLSPDRPYSPIVAPPPPPPIIEPPPKPPTFTSTDNSMPPWPVKEDNALRISKSVSRSRQTRAPLSVPVSVITAPPVPPPMPAPPRDMLGHQFMQPPPMIPPPMPIYPPPPRGPSMSLPPPPIVPPPPLTVAPVAPPPPTILVAKITMPPPPPSPSMMNTTQKPPPIHNPLPKLDVKITSLHPNDDSNTSVSCVDVTKSSSNGGTPYKTNTSQSTTLQGGNVMLRTSTPSGPTTFNPNMSSNEKSGHEISSRTVTNALLSALGIGMKPSDQTRTLTTDTRQTPFNNSHLSDFANHSWSQEGANGPMKLNSHPNTPVNGQSGSHLNSFSGRPPYRGRALMRGPSHPHRPPLHGSMPQSPMLGRGSYPMPNVPSPMGPGSSPMGPQGFRGSPNNRFRGGQRRNGFGGRPIRHS